MLTLNCNVPDMRPARLAGYHAVGHIATPSKPLGIEPPPRRPATIDVALLGSDPGNDPMRSAPRSSAVHLEEAIA